MNISAGVNDMEEPGVAIIYLIEKYELTGEGVVKLYEARPCRIPGGMLMERFYIVTLSTEFTERAWGSGPTPQQALEVAIAEWARNGLEDNPFQKVYDEEYGPYQED